MPLMGLDECISMVIITVFQTVNAGSNPVTHKRRYMSLQREEAMIKKNNLIDPPYTASLFFY